MLSLPSKIYLIDKNPSLVRRWEDAFSAFDEVKVFRGEYFDRPADAIVSASNSFGHMDGGLDKAIVDKLGDHVKMEVQGLIHHKYFGEMPVGTAGVISTGDPQWPNLVVAPTMRVPQDVAYTLNPYLAFRAVLLAVSEHNQNPLKWNKIDTLVCGGLGTGVGGVTPLRCAGQMRAAYSLVKDFPFETRSLNQVKKDQLNLETL